MGKHTSSLVRNTGAVRHGAECFNYYFPQELDDKFAIMCYKSGRPYMKYVDEYGLRCFLKEQVALGFTFPLNPKWVLCDDGWYAIYEALCKRTNVSTWFSPVIQEIIESIHKDYPNGLPKRNGTDNLDIGLAELELANHITKRLGSTESKTMAMLMVMGKTGMKIRRVTQNSIQYVGRGAKNSTCSVVRATNTGVNIVGNLTVDSVRQ